MEELIHELRIAKDIEMLKEQLNRVEKKLDELEATTNHLWNDAGRNAFDILR
jgi:hypothetical protein